MAESHAGLLIAALVAIVAVVGLVILFKGADAAGNAFAPPMKVGVTGLCGCPEGYAPKFTGIHGNLATCVCHKEPGVRSLY